MGQFSKARVTDVPVVKGQGHQTSKILWQWYISSQCVWAIPGTLDALLGLAVQKWIFIRNT